MKKKNKAVSKTSITNFSLKKSLENIQIQNDALNKILENVNHNKLKPKDKL